MSFTIVTIFLLASLYISTSWSLRIEISPSTFYTKDPNGPVNVSCYPDAGDIGNGDVYLMQITRKGQKPMVFLRATSGIVYGTHSDNPSLAMAEGHIDQDPSKTYLRLTLTSPVISDRGTYTCAMFFSDESGFLLERRAGSNLTVQELDVHGVIKALQEKVTLLENKLNDQVTKDSMVQRRLGIVEDETRNQSMRISDLDDKGSYMAFFSAGLNRDVIPAFKDTIIYHDVLVDQGHDYEPKTGVFTAPWTGLYGFRLLAMTNCNDCYIQLCITVNGDVLVCTNSYPIASYNHQASVSSVTILDKGDKVKVIVPGTVKGVLKGTQYYNQFTGYLMKFLK